jgi:hypothetical protein
LFGDILSHRFRCCGRVSPNRYPGTCYPS